MENFRITVWNHLLFTYSLCLHFLAKLIPDQCVSLSEGVKNCEGRRTFRPLDDLWCVVLAPNQRDYLIVVSLSALVSECPESVVASICYFFALRSLCVEHNYVTETTLAVKTTQDSNIGVVD